MRSGAGFCFFAKMQRLDRNCVTLAMWGEIEARVQLAVSFVALPIWGHDSLFSILSSNNTEDIYVIA